jgi:hypothetical protein
MERFGAAHLRVVGEAAEESPEHCVFEAMLDGWRTQRLSRNLAFGTVESGTRVLRRFQEQVGRYPWQWLPSDLENWLADLRSGEGRANSTVRSYGLTIAAFLTYACDPAYGWDALCLERFGTHPVQICGPANLAVHTVDQEARPQRRPLSKAECQALFDAADERAEVVRRRGAKGWAPAFRDAPMLKVAYAWGLRRRELLMLERRLRRVLDDGTGQVAPALEPLFESLTSMANPASGLNWLNKTEVEQRLGALACGTTPLTHEGIDTMPGPQGREFLRELLVDTGLLPQRDKYLAAFKAWCPKRLSSIADAATRNEISIYLAWRHLKDLTVRSEAGHLTAAVTAAARDHTDAAVRFLGFVAERGLLLSEVGQSDIDDWFATASNPSMAVDFISWATRSRRCGRLKLASQQRRSSPGCSSARVGEIVRRLLSDETITLGDRVAGLIVLLFAQQVSRVCELRLRDLAELDGELYVSLGRDPVVVPEPAAGLVFRYAAERWNMNTTNTGTEFLFPGRRPGEHIIAMQLRIIRLGERGITRTERQGALTYLLSEVPAAVVAKATGYSPATTAARAAQTGTDWARYVALKRATARSTLS